MPARNSHIRHWALLAILLAAAGCSRPVGDYQFISAETARQQGGDYLFKGSFDDPSATYRLTLAARIVTSRTDGETLTMDIRLTAADGTTTIERVALPLQKTPGVDIALGSGSTTDYSWPWRTMRGSEMPGEWTLSMRPADPALDHALYGAGLSCTIDDGKR